MKKLRTFTVCFIAALGLVLVGQTPAEAAATPLVVVDGHIMVSETESRQPYIDNGNTMISLRDFGKAVQGETLWNGVDQSVNFRIGAMMVHFSAGDDVMLRNHDDRITMPAPAVVKDGVFFVPLRALADAFEMPLDWNSTLNAALLGGWAHREPAMTDDPFFYDFTSGDGSGYILSLPEEWADNVFMIEYKNNEGTVNLDFYVKSIYDRHMKEGRENMGYLFTIHETAVPRSTIVPGVILKTLDDCFIEAVYPSDVRYDSQETDEYMRYFNQVPDVLHTFRYYQKEQSDLTSDGKQQHERLYLNSYPKTIDVSHLERTGLENIYALRVLLEGESSNWKDFARKAKRDDILNGQAVLVKETADGPTLYLVERLNGVWTVSTDDSRHEPEPLKAFQFAEYSSFKGVLNEID